MTTLIKRKPLFFDTDLWDFPTRMFKEDLFKDKDVPAVNIKDEGRSFSVEVAAPGYTKDELKVAVEGNLLTISSERKDEKKEEQEGYTRREWSYSAFSRSFQLPENADPESVKAAYTDGVLRLTVAKKENGSAPKQRTIGIQ